jgi:SagB-type dehydrogenase family enzyme
MPRRVDPDIAILYHLHSSNTRARLGNPEVAGPTRPRQFRTFPGVSRVSLPSAPLELSESLGSVLARRESTRDFSDEALPLADLARLLDGSYGVRGERDDGEEWALVRPSPSAGGLYPIELYVATARVEELTDGVYHYDPRTRELELLAAGGFQDEIGALTIGQDMIARANVVVLLAAAFDRTMWKYGQRGYRYVWLDAGHVAQNLYLVATALRLGVVAVGGFIDDEVAEVFRLPEDERPIYLVCAGRVPSNT